MKFTFTITFTGAIAAVLLLAACAEPLPPPPDAIARVGDTHLRWPAFEAYVAAEAGAATATLDSAAASALLDRFLDEEMLRRLAVDRSLVPATATRRDAVAALIAAADLDPVTSADVDAFYAAHPELYDRPERVRLRQILVPDRATAEALRRELADGADFAELARTYSTDASGPAGGLQGELARGELPPTLAAVVFALEPGETSPVVAADYGFHLFRVDERLPAGRLPLDRVRPAIRRRLERERADAALAELEAAARKRYNPVVHAAHLPFPYDGIFPTRRVAAS